MSVPVTIGVPVYNAERHLEGALRDLAAQTYRDIVVVVSDNASTDRTEQICRDLAATDARIRYFRRDVNIGAARNFVRCVELAETPYFRWAASDDRSAPTFVERCVEVLDAHPDVVLAYPKTLLIDGAGAEIGRYEDGVHAVDGDPVARYQRVMKNLRLVNAIYGVVRLDALRRTQIHGSYPSADVVVFEEIALHGKIWEVPEYLLMRRLHADAHSAMSVEGKEAHYNPTHRGVGYQQWRMARERMAVVGRAPLSLRDRLRLAWILIRKTVGQREQLLRELAHPRETAAARAPR